MRRRRERNIQIEHFGDIGRLRKGGRMLFGGSRDWKKIGGLWVLQPFW